MANIKHPKVLFCADHPNPKQIDTSQPASNTVDIGDDIQRALSELCVLRPDRLPISDEIGEVVDETAPGRTDRLSPLWLREKMSGTPPRDLGEADLLFPPSALRDPILKTYHVAKVRDMLLYVTERYRPDLLRHPEIDRATDNAIALILSVQNEFATLTGPYTRWNLMAATFFDTLDGKPVGEVRKTVH